MVQPFQNTSPFLFLSLFSNPWTSPMNRPCVMEAMCLITTHLLFPPLWRWIGIYFQEEFLEELCVKLSEKGGTELRKAVVKDVRNRDEENEEYRARRKNEEPEGNKTLSLLFRKFIPGHHNHPRQPFLGLKNHFPSLLCQVTENVSEYGVVELYWDGC